MNGFKTEILASNSIFCPMLPTEIGRAEIYFKTVDLPSNEVEAHESEFILTYKVMIVEQGVQGFLTDGFKKSPGDLPIFGMGCWGAAVKLDEPLPTPYLTVRHWTEPAGAGITRVNWSMSVNKPTKRGKKCNENVPPPANPPLT